MAKTKKSLDNRQLSFLDLIQESERSKTDPQDGAFDIDSQYREVITSCLKNCPLSRYQVAARMSELLGREITKSMLDSWTAESKDGHRMPAIFLPAFCQAVGSYEPLKLLGRLIGIYVLPGPEALRAEIQRYNEKLSRIKKEIQKRKYFLMELEGRK